MEIKVIELKMTDQNRPIKLRFSPTAWAKLTYLRDVADTEVGGFGICPPDDLLYVEDFFIPKQKCSAATVEFDDEAIADMTEDFIDEGYMPEQFMRVWIHTHPKMSPSPSKTDEETFDKIFGRYGWAIMFILSSDNTSYCRLRINDGPFPGSFEIPVEVDFDSYEFDGSDYDGWEQEHKEKVTEIEWSRFYSGPGSYGGYYGGYGAKRSRNGISGVKGHVHRLIPDYDEMDIYDGDYEDPVGLMVGPNGDFLDLSIPEDVREIMSPNDMILLENMSPEEREMVIEDIRSKIND